MKKIYLGVAATLWALNSLGFAAAFEGKVHYKKLGKESGEGREMEFSIKGDKFRIEVAAHGHLGVTIMDTKTKQAIMLMPDRKTYSVMKLDQNPKANPKTPLGKLIKTGKTETIAGYLAQEWAYEGGESKISLWGNKDLGAWGFGGGHSQEAPVEIPEEFKNGGFFPLRMVSHGGGMEATKVEKKALPDSLFEVPAGYTKMDGPSPSLRGLSPEQNKAVMDGMKNMTPEQKAMMEKIMHGKHGQ